MKNKIQFSLVIPFYNEEKIMKTVLSDLISSLKKLKLNYNIIAVNNGSTDNTQKIISELSSKEKTIKILNIPINQGYGYGIASGLKVADGEIIGFMDGDGQVSPEDLIKCFNAIKKDKSINLCKVNRELRNDGLSRKFWSTGFNTLMKLVFNVKSKDINSCPKLFKKSLYNKIKPITSKDWFIDSEILIKAKKHKAKIVEIPISFKKRTEGNSKVKTQTIPEFIKNIILVKLRGFK